MSSRRVLVVAFVLLLAALAIGCSAQPTVAAAGAAKQTSSPGQATAAPQPTQKPGQAQVAAKVETPAGTPTTPRKANGDSETLAFADVGDLDKFGSYRLVNELSSTEERGAQTSLTITTEFVAEPRAQRMAISSTDKDGKQQSMEVIQIGNTTYTNLGGQWMAMSSSTQEITQQIGMPWQPGDFLTGAKGTYVGREAINGLDSRHYSYDKSAFALGALTTTLEASAEVWVSTQYNVYDKVIVRVVTLDPEKGRVSIDLRSLLSDINQPLTIQPPEGVAKPGLPEDVPVVAGATDLTFLGTTGSFKTDMPVDQVAEFYKTQMAASGWTLAEGLTPEMLSFSKGQRSALIMIADESGKSSVTIVIDTAEATQPGAPPVTSETPAP
jgi:hypothetical protein